MLALEFGPKTKNVGKIELQFGASVVAGRNFVAGHHWLVQDDSRPVSGVAALRRHIAVNQADTCHALIRLRRSFARRPPGLRLGRLCVGRLILGLIIVRLGLSSLRWA